MAMSDEELIEKAFNAHEGAPTWEADPVGRDAAIRWHMRGFHDALAVFREHTAPADDEREALASLIDDELQSQRIFDLRDLADAILAAGFRRGAPAEPAVTDEMVERAVESRYPLLLTGTLAEYERRYDNYGEEVRAIHQAQAKADMRAALEAALIERGKP